MQNSSLGNFARLPLELREMIWEEFLPTGQGGELATGLEPPVQDSVNVDLKVLRVSKYLYGEISRVIYMRSFLQFDLAYLSSESTSLCGTVRFKRLRGFQPPLDGGAIWRLESEKIRDHTICFKRFPLKKLARIEINLPISRKPLYFCWLWRNVLRTLELLDTVKLPALIIRLQDAGDQYEVENKNFLYQPIHIPNERWLVKIDASTGLLVSEFLLDGKGHYIYNALTLPFYLIERARAIQVDIQSEDIKRQMDWSLIDQADKVFSWRREKRRDAEFYLALGELYRNTDSIFREMYTWSIATDLTFGRRLKFVGTPDYWEGRVKRFFTMPVWLKIYIRYIHNNNMDLLDDSSSDSSESSGYTT